MKNPKRTGLLGHLDHAKRKVQQIVDIAHNKDNGHGTIEGHAHTALHAINEALAIAEGEEREP